jgi:TonB-dependent starch-binding outer membrane protein SusC
MKIKLTKHAFWLKVMRFTLLQLILVGYFSIFSFAKTIHGQDPLDKKISLSLDNKEMGYVLKQIETQANIKFAFSPQAIDMTQKVSVKAQNEPLISVFNTVFKPLNIKYEVTGKYILLTPKTEFSNLEQTKPNALPTRTAFKVAGTVIDDSNNEPLIGVSIVLKGTVTGTVTDIDGKYSLEIPDGKGILVFSYIGYNTQEVAVNDRNTVDIKLVTDAQKLDEYVVVGYGERKRDELSGAVTSINSDMISLQPVLSVDQALAGMVPGVTLREGTGAPGAGPEILIRGVNTFGNNKPLIVIDDVIFEGTKDDQNNNPLSLLNPEDIESVTILKDAASKAIFGSRATAGVIIVTTKKGKLGKAKVSFNHNLSFSDVLPFEKPDVLNATELAQFYKEVNIDRIRATNPLYSDIKTGVPDSLIPAQYRNPGQYGTGTNWFDEITRRAMSTTHNISASGGTENVKYYVSANYLKQEGVLINNDIERISLRSNLEMRLNNKLRLNISLNPTRTEANRNADDPSGGQFSAGSSITSSYWVDPSAPIYASEGVYNYLTKGSLTTSWTANPVYQLNSEIEKRRKIQMLMGGSLQYEPVKNLILKSKISYNLEQGRARNFKPSLLATGDGLNPIVPSLDSAVASVFNTYRNNIVFDNTANYRFKIGGKSDFNILAGMSTQDVTAESSSITAKRILDENFVLPDANNVSKTAAGAFVGSEEFGQNRLLAFFGRLNYNYDDKYLVNFSFRTDGSSRFGRSSTTQYGEFPAGSFTWRASEEGFLKKYTWLSDLRFEVGYGITGNQNDVSSYGHLGSISAAPYSFGGQILQGNNIASLPNASITWEESEQLDIGFNASFFKERIKTSFNWYQQITDGLLAQIPISWATGFGNVVGNQDSRIRNRGFEAQIDVTPIRGKGLNWTTSVNASAYKNLILEYFDPRGFNSGLAGNGTQIAVSAPGSPVGMYRGLKVLGLFTAAEIADSKVPKYAGAREGSLKYLDGNGDGKLDIEADYVILGNPHPDLMFGWNNNLTYKGFSFRSNVAGQLGGLIYDLRREIMWNVDGNFNINREMLDRWRPGDDPTTKIYPSTVSLTGSTTRYVRFPSSNKVYDGSYLALKNITLSYNLGKFLNRKRRLLEAAEIYASVRNVFYISAYKYGNPEIRRSNDGSALRSVNYGSYPISRVVALGFNVSL